MFSPILPLPRLKSGRGRGIIHSTVTKLMPSLINIGDRKACVNLTRQRRPSGFFCLLKSVILPLPNLSGKIPPHAKSPAPMCRVFCLVRFPSHPRTGVELNSNPSNVLTGTKDWLLSSCRAKAPSPYSHKDRTSSAQLCTEVSYVLYHQ